MNIMIFKIYLKFCEYFQIDVVADLPVGENLQDHMMFPVALSINQSLTVGPQELFGFWSQLKYSLYKGGMDHTYHRRYISALYRLENVNDQYLHISPKRLITLPKQPHFFKNKSNLTI